MLSLSNTGIKVARGACPAFYESFFAQLVVYGFDLATLTCRTTKSIFLVWMDSSHYLAAGNMYAQKVRSVRRASQAAALRQSLCMYRVTV